MTITEVTDDTDLDSIFGKIPGDPISADDYACCAPRDDPTLPENRQSFLCNGRMRPRVDSEYGEILACTVCGRTAAPEPESSSQVEPPPADEGDTE